jgi:predicted dehydrogenase
MNEFALRIGVVGAGYWGPNLIRNCAELGVLDSVCDIDEAALATIQKGNPSVFTTTHFEAMLARPIQGVIVAAPAQLHASMCLKALSAGKHVFVEKPLALSVEEGRRIADAAQAAGLSVFVGHLLLYHPAVKKLRATIAEGLIGEVWHVRSRRLSLGKLRSHENVWWSFAPHDTALMLAIMGEEPQAATSAQTCGRRTSISDVAYADFEFSEGRSAHIEVCWLDPEKSARLDVFGSQGVITWTDSRQGSALRLTRFTTTEDSRGLPVVLRGEEQQIAFEEGEPMRAELLAFMDSIVTGQPAETDARQGTAVLRALAMADGSARGRPGLKALA